MARIWGSHFWGPPFSLTQSHHLPLWAIVPAARMLYQQGSQDHCMCRW